MSRQDIAEDIRLQLGDGMVDVELDPEHVDHAITFAIRKYRQRSSNSMQEGFVFLDVQRDTAMYTLPAEVQEVQSILRRSIGGTMGGAAIDPFSLAFSNNIYMIQNPGGLSSGGAGSLALYDSAVQFQNLVGRMFGRDVQFSWNAATKQITVHRRFSAGEEIAIHCWLQTPEAVLFVDPYARPWLTDYATARAKMMLGQGRSKFASLAGPQGGVTLNGESLKSEAVAEMEKLEKELMDGVDAHMGFSFCIG